MKLLVTSVGKVTGLLTLIVVVIAAVLTYFDDPDPVKYER